MSAQDCGRRGLHAAPTATPSPRSAGSDYYLGDHLAGEPRDLRGLLGTLPPQALHGLDNSGVARTIGGAGFAAIGCCRQTYGRALAGPERKARSVSA